jgi:hypothetical protein
MALETPIPATSGACLNSFCCLAENLKPVVCEVEEIFTLVGTFPDVVSSEPIIINCLGIFHE